MTLPMFPKPGQIKNPIEAVKVYPDGREECNMKCKAGRDEYQSRKLKMWDRQGRRCALQIALICKKKQGRWPQDETTFDHENGRGTGGSKRDDRIEIDGKPVNAAVCWYCNSEKGSKKIPYLGDVP